MTKPRPTPLDSPRDFRINEMFFSTTDRRGVIQSGNGVFERVSGYTWDELFGQPHNVIRHPHMPRSVFRVVWSFLLKANPVAGFVKNLASDGRHYWVVAFLMPIAGGRFLSIRFKPSSGLLPVVEDLYRRMCACERECEAAAKGGEAMQAAEELMLGALRERGFASYDAFMRALLHGELKSRDAAIAQQGLSLFPAELAGGADDRRSASLRAIHASGLAAYRQIELLYVQLDEFTALNDKLAEKSAFVLGLTREFRFIAFNAALRSARLGEEGRSLIVIADYLNTVSARLGGAVETLTQRIAAISEKLREVIFNLAAARLQIEMVLGFCAELHAIGAQEPAASRRQRMIEDLQLAFAETVACAVRTLAGLERDLALLGDSSADLRRLVLTMQVAQVGGLVEACRLKDDDSFTVMFADLRLGVEGTKAALEELDGAGARLAVLAEETPRIERIISQAVAAMAGAVRALHDSTPATNHQKVDTPAGGMDAPVRDAEPVLAAV